MQLPKVLRHGFIQVWHRLSYHIGLFPVCIYQYHLNLSKLFNSMFLFCLFWTDCIHVDSIYSWKWLLILLAFHIKFTIFGPISLQFEWHARRNEADATTSSESKWRASKPRPPPTCTSNAMKIYHGGFCLLVNTYPASECGWNFSNQFLISREKTWSRWITFANSKRAGNLIVYQVSVFFFLILCIPFSLLVFLFRLIIYFTLYRHRLVFCRK